LYIQGIQNVFNLLLDLIRFISQNPGNRLIQYYESSS